MEAAYYRPESVGSEPPEKNKTKSLVSVFKVQISSTFLTLNLTPHPI
jgi:hypothetical protein